MLEMEEVRGVVERAGKWRYDSRGIHSSSLDKYIQ